MICASRGQQTPDGFPAEADARVRAAQQLHAAGRRADADEQQSRALDFWRSVDAVHYIKRSPPLLARSA